MARDIETWGQVHAMGDGRKPWNRGKRTGKWLAVDAAVTEQRFRERRQRDAEWARSLGVDEGTIADYLELRGEYRRG